MGEQKEEAWKDSETGRSDILTEIDGKDLIANQN